MEKQEDQAAEATQLSRVASAAGVFNDRNEGERVRAMAAGLEQDDLRLKVEEFGALWLATLMDRDIELAGIVDSVVPPAERETGPSIVEYSLFCIFKHMIEQSASESSTTGIDARRSSISGR